MSSNKPGTTDLASGMPYIPDDKFAVSKLEAMERYGVEAQPIPADEAYKAPIPNFSKKDALVEKWILVNYKANDGQGTMTFVNTLDGQMGSGFKQSVATFPLDPKKLREKLRKEFQKVDIKECPIAVTPEEAKKHHTETELQATTDAAGEATEEQEKAGKR